MKTLIFIILVSLILRLGLSTAIYSGDLNNHVQWGQSILADGFAGVYSREFATVLKPTYPPIPLFSFTTSVALFDISNSLARHLNLVYPFFPSGLIWWFEDQDTLPAFTKITTIIADLGVGLLIYYFARIRGASTKLSLVASSAYMLNPAVWYVSALWGQIESLPLLFLFLGLLFCHKQKPYWAVASFTAMVLTKQTSIIFIPIIGLLFLRLYKFKTIILQGLIAVILFWLAYLPFNQQFTLGFPFEIYLDRINTGSGSVWITDHAFNPWALLTRLEKIPDYTPVLFGISAQAIGLIGFTALTLLLVYKFWLDRLDIFLVYASISMFAFLVLTKMHERYLAPALPFFIFLCIKKPNLWPVFAVLSISHLINLYHEWYFPRILGFDTFVADWSTIVAVIIAMTLIGLLHLKLILSSKSR